MLRLLPQIAGAALSLLFCDSFGRLTLRALPLPLSTGERRLYSPVLGAAAASLVMLLLGAVHLFYLPILLGIAAGAFFCARLVYAPSPAVTPAQIPRSGLLLKLIFWGSYLVFAGAYLTIALAPEVSPDGTAYHTGIIARYWRDHALTPIYTTMYAGMPQGAEMVYLVAFAIGKNAAAALVHWCFWLLLPLLLISVLRRFGRGDAGFLAGTVLFTCPLIAWDGSTAYVDVFLLTVLVASFGITEVWIRSRAPACAIAAGALAGYACSIKFTAFPIVLYLAMTIAVQSRLKWQVFLRPMLSSMLAALCFTLPWLLRNVAFYRNPFFPFANGLFPNPFMHASLEHAYGAAMRHYRGFGGPLTWPLEITVHGAVLQGFLGPAFLLIPVGLLAARHPEGRRLLVLGLLLFTVYPQNIGSRFLLPSALFLACALCCVVAEARPAAVILALFGMWTSWPTVARTYSAPGAVLADHFQKKFVFGRESNESYRARMLGDGYLAAELVDAHVPADTRVLLLDGVLDGYTHAELLTVYQGALNQRWFREFFTRMMQAKRIQLTFTIPAGAGPTFRLVQMQDAQGGGEASVCEIAARSGAHSLALAPLRSQPNSFDVSLAADGNEGTCWDTWEKARSGDFIDFTVDGHPDKIAVDVPPDAPLITWELQAGGRPISPSVSEVNVPADLPSIVASDLRHSGVNYVLVNHRLNPDERWPVSLLGHTGTQHLYELRSGN